MKAIKINVETQSFEEIQISNWKDIAPAIGNGCTLFCVPVSFENYDSIYVDDESVLNHENVKGAFIMEGWSYPLFGNGIILGTNQGGDSTDVKKNIEDYKKEFVFIKEQTAKKYARMLFNQDPIIMSF